MTILAQGNISRLPISNNSVDLILIDPPYPKEFLPCYGWLAQEAMRVLKTGGFVLAMCGGMYLPKIYAMFEESGLKYWWEYYHYSSGDRPVIWPRQTVAPVKPIICYSKGEASARCWNILGQFDSKRMDKRFHHWGQDVESARYYIDCFSDIGDLVLDPFVGGGTTAIACELIGRRCIALDLDFSALTISKNRLIQADVPEQLYLPVNET